jgi:hypothetical protein
MLSISDMTLLTFTCLFDAFLILVGGSLMEGTLEVLGAKGLGFILFLH